MYETIFHRSNLIEVEESSPTLRKIPFFELMTEFCEGYQTLDVDGCQNFAVVWNDINDELSIEQIYNHDTGEVYWEDFENRVGDAWTDNDETLVNSLLMWGDLESTIDGGY